MTTTEYTDMARSICSDMLHLEQGGASGWRISGISGTQYVAELLAYDAELGRDKACIRDLPLLRPRVAP